MVLFLFYYISVILAPVINLRDSSSEHDILQNPGTYGLMQYRQPSVQNMVPSINQGGTPRGAAPGLTPGTTPRNYTMSPGSYLASAYRAVQGLQYPMRYPGGVTGYLPPYTANRQSAASSSVDSNTRGQVEGCHKFILKCFSNTC